MKNNRHAAAFLKRLFYTSLCMSQLYNILRVGALLLYFTDRDRFDAVCVFFAFISTGVAVIVLICVVTANTTGIIRLPTVLTMIIATFPWLSFFFGGEMFTRLLLMLTTAASAASVAFCAADISKYRRLCRDDERLRAKKAGSEDRGKDGQSSSGK